MASGQLTRVLGHIRRLVGVRSAEAGTDAELLARFVSQREEAAFARLVERHGPMVRAVCRRVLQHDHDADDAFQATFLVLARKAAAIRKYGSVGSWLYGTAYRLALKMRAGAAKRQTREAEASTAPETTAVLPHATPELDRHELRAVLDQELSLLPEKYRAPLVLCYLEGRTNEEAAAQLNWTKGTVSGRLARARDLLRVRLSRRGMALPAAGLGTVIGEQLAAGSVPQALLDSTTTAAVAFAATNAGAAAGISARVAALAEGVLRTMWLTKVKVAAAVFLAVSLVAAGSGFLALRTQSLGVAAPVGAREEEPSPKTDPPGVPLELRLVAKKDTYTLDLGQKTSEELKKEIENSKTALPTPAVDLELELRNTGKEELKIWIIASAVGSNTPPPGTDAGVQWDLQGPGAVTRSNSVSVNTPLYPRAGEVSTLGPGQSRSFAIKGLSTMVGRVKGSDLTFGRSYWTKPGEYTLSASFHVAVSPVPKGAAEAYKGYGHVTVPSNSVKLKVVDAKQQGKTDPPGVPLELKLVAKKDTYTLDLGGKTAEQFQQQIKDAERVKGLPEYPPAPEVDLVAELHNTSDQDIRVCVGGAFCYVSGIIEGPGAINKAMRYTVNTPAVFDPKTQVTTIKPGGSHSLPLGRLAFSNFESYDCSYWTQPGEYTLTLKCATRVAPIPKGVKESSEAGYALVVLTSAPIKLKVVDAKAQGKTDPPGVPLELKLVANKGTYTLDLGGKTTEEFRKLLEAGPCPAPQAVDLVAELVNKSDQEVKVLVGDETLELAGKGAVKVVAVGVGASQRMRSGGEVTLGPGKRFTCAVKNLAYGIVPPARTVTETRLFWTETGEYTIALSLPVSVSPAPAGSKETGLKGFGRVILTSAPVNIKVVEAKDQAKTDPPGVPLELTLVAKKDTYVLDPEATKNSWSQPVDLSLELQNRGNQEVKVRLKPRPAFDRERGVGVSDSYIGLRLDVQGNASLAEEGNDLGYDPPPVEVVTIAPGKSHTMPLKSLCHPARGGATCPHYCWKGTGEFQLTAGLEIAVSPAPKNAANAGNGFGTVTLKSNTVKFKVVDRKDEPQAKSDPPGVPLELKLLAKKDTYALDLKGRAPDQFTLPFLKSRSAPPPPEVELEAQFHNTSDKEIGVWIGGTPATLTFDLMGPGAINVEAGVNFDKTFKQPTFVKIAPGKSHALAVTNLGYYHYFPRSYWVKPGDYTLSISYRTGISPAPKGAKDVGSGFGEVTLTSAPLKLKVTEPKK